MANIHLEKAKEIADAAAKAKEVADAAAKAVVPVFTADDKYNIPSGAFSWISIILATLSFIGVIALGIVVFVF